MIPRPLCFFPFSSPQSSEPIIFLSSIIQKNERMLYSYHQPCLQNSFIIFVIFRELYLLFREELVILTICLNIKFIKTLFFKIRSLISFFMWCLWFNMLFPGGAHRYPPHKSQILGALLWIMFWCYLETVITAVFFLKKILQ